MTKLISLLAAAFLFAFAAPSASQAQEAEILASGSWDNQEYSIAGDWRIENRADGTYLVLSDEFRTRRGPDLKIFFHASAADDVTGNNAADGFFLTELDSNRGGQEYRLPEDFDLADYASVVIHCERFSKLWGAGALNA
jgi:hypothetical protein